MTLDLTSLGNHILPYLSQPLRAGMLQELKNYKNLKNFYFTPSSGDALQGDSWTGLDIFNIATGERKLIRGILLSNTCDISPENSRVTTPNVSFCPLINLSSYIKRLRASGLPEEKIEQKVSSIKSQHVTNIMYFPPGPTLEEEYIVDFANTHSLPLSHFLGKKDKKRLFALSQIAFYLFILKLSIHFCRLHEGVDRGGAPSTEG